MDERMKSLETVRAALPVFSQINDLYMAADGIYQKASLDDARADGKVKNSKGKAIAFAVATWFVMDILFYLIGGLVSKIIPSAGAVFSVGWVILSIITCIVVYKRVISSTKKTLDNEADALIAKNKYDLECISNDICEIYRENEEIIAQIPRDYRTYDAVSYFEHLLENGHADSMKEALILYDENVHRLSQRLDNQRIIQQNIQQREMLAHIEQQTRTAAHNSSVAAAFSIASYIIVSDRLS